MACLAPVFIALLAAGTGNVLKGPPGSPAVMLAGVPLFFGFVWMLWLCVWLNLPTRVQQRIRKWLRPPVGPEA